MAVQLDPSGNPQPASGGQTVSPEEFRKLQEQLAEMQRQMQTQGQPSGGDVPEGHNVLADASDALGNISDGAWHPRTTVTRDPVTGEAIKRSVFGHLLAHVGVPDAVLVSMPMAQQVETILQKYDIPAHILHEIRDFEHVIGLDRALSRLGISRDQNTENTPNSQGSAPQPVTARIPAGAEVVSPESDVMTAPSPAPGLPA